MPAMTERFEMRLDQDLLSRIDAWMRSQPEVSTKAEAIRRLIEAGLWTPSEPVPQIQISDGERLVLHMLCDLFKHLEVRSEVDPKFVKEVLFGGHNWALRWQYSGIFHGHVDKRRTVSEVGNILDMWSSIESGFTALSKPDKERLKEEAQLFGEDPRFPGFDGNNESDYFSIARFMIEEMGRFESFKGRELNAHMPTLDIHFRMLAVFEPMKQTLTGGKLSVTQLIELFKERIHSERRKK